eukprot:m.309974 g.309974  ORF g.309974 m.309974 type:complete len:262 (+) comp48880_c0_seq1:10-795(+)
MMKPVAFPSLFLLCLAWSYALDIPDGLQKLLKIEKPEDGADYKLPTLDFDYNALEPYIDEKTVRVHHLGHHAGYTHKMNAILRKWAEKKEQQDLLSLPIVNILEQVNDIPLDIREDLQNHGGGFINHAWYWATIAPVKAESRESEPVGSVAGAIEKRYGDFKKFQQEFNHTAFTFFGSGYVWLCEVPPTGILQITTFPNQMSPLGFGLKPILVLDVWEHAYYLKHQNKRAGYVHDWWEIIDWNKVELISQAWKNEQAKDEL